MTPTTCSASTSTSHRGRAPDRAPRSVQHLATEQGCGVAHAGALEALVHDGAWHHRGPWQIAETVTVSVGTALAGAPRTDPACGTAALDSGLGSERLRGCEMQRSSAGTYLRVSFATAWRTWPSAVPRLFVRYALLTSGQSREGPNAKLVVTWCAPRSSTLITQMPSRLSRYHLGSLIAVIQAGATQSQ